jgi:hypothetical protein
MRRLCVSYATLKSIGDASAMLEIAWMRWSMARKRVDCGSCLINITRYPNTTNLPLDSVRS